MILRAGTPIASRSNYKGRHIPISFPVGGVIRRSPGAPLHRRRGLHGTAPGGFPCSLTDAQIQDYLAKGATVDSVNTLCSSYCYWPLPGAIEPPGLPQCSQVPGGGTTNNPLVEGLLPGMPGYADALQGAVLGAQQEEAANPSQNYGSAQLKAQLTAYTKAAPAKTSTGTKTSTGAKSTAQSNAPAPGVQPSPSGTTGQSNAPASTTVPIDMGATSAGNFFTASMFGGIPNWALLAGAGLGVWFLSRGQK